MEPGKRDTKGSSTPVNIIDLKPGMENVTVRGRVLETTPPRTIDTSKGARTISNAVLGDASGRVEVVMWGDKVTSLKEGDVVEIKGAWVSEYKGKVQLNIGRSTTVSPVESTEIPEQIPDNEPKATGSYVPRPRRGFNRRRFNRREGGRNE